MSTKKQIKLVPPDLQAIYGQDYHLFEVKVIPNCWCAKCATPYASTIVNYSIYLNDLNDIILKGSCAKCHSPINRYLETGEVEKYVRRIMQIRKKH